MLQPRKYEKILKWKEMFILHKIIEQQFLSQSLQKFLVSIYHALSYINQKQLHVIQLICKSFMIFKVVFGNEIHVMSSKETITYSKLQAFIKSVFKKLPAKYTLTYKDSDQNMICLLNDVDMKILSESGMAKVRIQIQECSEDFYDHTQEIVIEEKPILKQEQKPVVQKTEASQVIQQSPLDNASEVKSIDESINEKLSKIMPDIISKIKEQVMTESKLRQPKVFEKKTEEKMEEKQLQVEKNHPVVHQRVTCDQCGAFPIVGIRYKCVVCPDFDVCQNCEAKSTHDHPFLKIKKIKHTPMKIFAVIDDQQESLELNGQKIPLPGLNEGMRFLGNLLGGGMRPEHCRRDFGKCRENFKKMAHNFKQFMSQNNQKFGQPCKTETKVEQKVEVKVEPKVQQVKPEVKKEQALNQPVITEQKLPEEKKEQKKPQIKEQKKSQSKPKLSQQDLFVEAANYISQIMNIQFKKIYRFVVNYPGLNKQQILMKYLEQ